MKHALLILSLLFLASCASTAKKSAPRELIESPHKEKALDSSVDVVAYEQPIMIQEVSEEAEYLCEPEDALFLLSAPHEVVSISKDFYSSIMRTNHNAQEYASKYFSYLKSEISIEEFLTYQMLSTEHLKATTEEHKQILPLFVRSYQAQDRINRTYGICAATIEKTLLSKKVDPKKKGCELEQHKVIIFDPFNMKRTLLEAVRLEMHIQEHLFQVNEIIDKHMNKQISDEEMEKQVNAVYEHMMEEKLPEKSQSMAKDVRNALDRSYSVKDQCLQKKK